MLFMNDNEKYSNKYSNSRMMRLLLSLFINISLINSRYKYSKDRIGK